MGQLESWNGWKGPWRPPGLSLKPTGGWVLCPSPGLRRGLAERAEHKGAAEALSAPHTGPSARADAIVEVPSPTPCQKFRFTALGAILPDCSSEENPLSLGENPFSTLIPGAQHLDPLRRGDLPLTHHNRWNLKPTYKLQGNAKITLEIPSAWAGEAGALQNPPSSSVFAPSRARDKDKALGALEDIPAPEGGRRGTASATGAPAGSVSELRR